MQELSVDHKAGGKRDFPSPNLERDESSAIDDSAHGEISELSQKRSPIWPVYFCDPDCKGYLKKGDHPPRDLEDDESNTPDEAQHDENAGLLQKRSPLWPVYLYPLDPDDDDLSQLRASDEKRDIPGLGIVEEKGAEEPKSDETLIPRQQHDFDYPFCFFPNEC